MHDGSPECLTRKWRIVDAKHRMKIWKLKLMQSNWDLFMRRIVTGDETWIHHYDPETKQQSMQWKHASSPSPRKFKVQASAGKIMCTFFWDAEGILLIDYMPHKVTITGGLLPMLTYFGNCASQLKRSAEESWLMYPCFCTTMHLLTGRMLDKLQ